MLKTVASPAWVCDGCGKAHLRGAWAFQFIVYRLDSHDSEMVTIANACDLDCLQIWLAEQAESDRQAAG